MASLAEEVVKVKDFLIFRVLYDEEYGNLGVINITIFVLHWKDYMKLKTYSKKLETPEKYMKKIK